MQFLNKLYSWYGKRTVIVIMAVIVGLIMIGLFSVFGNGDEAPATEEVKKSEVTVRPVRNLISGSTFNAIGEVRAVSEANLQTESGGRVTAVNVQIGDTVRAGTVIATLENSAQRAALLQAEGSYEVALANSKATLERAGSGIRDAETGLVNANNQAATTIRSAYNAANNALLVTIDVFFSNPKGMLPGVRIDRANTSFLNSERVAFQSIMEDWQSEANNVRDTSDLPRLLAHAETRTERLMALLDELISATNRAGNTDQLNGQPVPSFTAGLIAERSTLNGQLQAIRNAESGLISAEESVVRANIGDTPADSSLSDAQVKIALGSLRSAQANYEKTIVRTPISGVINALYLKAGEYVSPSAPAAIVANNNGLEISTGVSLEDSQRLSIGNVVTIDGTASGTIQAIAGAIDPTTGKVALKIGINEASKLKNGSTVSVQFSVDTDKQTAQENILIPLSAIKMTGSGPVVFEVSAEDNTLRAIPVTLGTVSGENVVIKSGITVDSNIVVDARGLKEGQEVIVSAN